MQKMGSIPTRNCWKQGWRGGTGSEVLCIPLDFYGITVSCVLRYCIWRAPQLLEILQIYYGSLQRGVDHYQMSPFSPTPLPSFLSVISVENLIPSQAFSYSPALKSTNIRTYGNGNHSASKALPSTSNLPKLAPPRLFLPVSAHIFQLLFIFQTNFKHQH